MTFRLYYQNSATGVELFPEYDFKERSRKMESRTRTTTGAEYAYKFGSYDAWRFKLTFVSSETKSIVNSWWESNADLLFVETGQTNVSSVHLTNRETPIFGYMKPHDDQFHGMLELSTY
jgi:hypothetical protein